MSQVIDLNESRLRIAAGRGFRNWTARFKEPFGITTRLSHISLKTLSFLAQGRDQGAFYLYDLIMNLKGLGTGFEFNELSPKEKMSVIDHYLFLLDRIRFECMKKLGLLESYPGENFALVELIVHFEKLAPGLQAEIPILRSDHPGHKAYTNMTTFDKEVFIRKMIPKVLAQIVDYSTTL